MSTPRHAILLEGNGIRLGNMIYELGYQPPNLSLSPALDCPPCISPRSCWEMRERGCWTVVSLSRGSPPQTPKPQL